MVLSYLAAVGLGVLVWQVWLDKPLDWTVPGIAFVLLVAVGADYNLLLMKRVREEAPDGAPEGIARAVAATGRVITAAGLIFAASMFAMMSGSVLTLAQVGFTIGMGLLLDTYLIRTLVVPAIATLLGERIWWPAVGRSAEQTQQRGETGSAEDHDQERRPQEQEHHGQPEGRGARAQLQRLVRPTKHLYADQG